MDLRVALALVAALAVTALTACGPSRSAVPEPAAEPPPLIPLPRAMETGSGRLTLTAASTVAVAPDDERLRARVDAALEPLRARWGLPLPIARDAGGGAAALALRLTGEGDERTGLGRVPTRPGEWSEAYTLRIETDGAGLEAEALPGLLHGLRTLEQLALPGGTLPVARIDDAPRFSYRGLHLDVGRHFFPVEFILRYVDLLAGYKLNAFHWHLTDDQGWRIEIRSRPRLARVAAFRAETRVGHAGEPPYVGDGKPYGGYYTQEDVRRVVAYAAERGVTVIPEIEMPGHARAALAAYPELACAPGPYEVATSWGVFDEIFCPSEATFTFLEEVLAEVMDLFPSRYIHIGGDEAPRTAWRQSPLAQEVIRREGLADEHELQSWFIRRVGRFLAGHGRRLIGWDEILEGGLAPDATVMSWRGEVGGIEAARQGHDVVMTPNPVAYLDHYQGDPDGEPLAIGGLTTVEEIYGWEPVPAELAPAEAERVLGGQGNLWTEYIKTPEHVEYMVFPRLLALAEVLWSPAEARHLRAFQARLGASLGRLDERGVRYRLPTPLGLASDRIVLTDEVELDVRPPAPGWDVLVGLDGSAPGADTPRWGGPRRIALPEGGLTVAARVRHPSGRLGPVARARFTRGSLRSSTARRTDLIEGLTWERLDGDYSSVADLADQPVAERGIARGSWMPPGAPPEHFGLRFRGWLDAPLDGVYTFHLLSDDGSRLSIADAVVVDHDGLHGPAEASGQVALAAGLHPLELLYFQAGGGRALRLEVTTPDGERGGVGPWLRAEPPAG
jgi:hexosaminidase